MNTFEAIIQDIEGRLTPEVKRDYDKLVTAGLQYVMHRGQDGAPPLLAMLQRSADPISACVLGAINLATKFLPGAARGRGKPIPVSMVYASKTLMYKGLEVVDRARLAKVGTEEITRAEHIWTNNIFKAFGMRPQQLDKAATAVHGIMNNPTAMEKIHRQTGYVRDPRASTPTVTEDRPLMNRAARRAAGRQ